MARRKQPKSPPKHTSLPDPAANLYVPLDHPAAKRGGLREVLAETAAYAEAMGTDALGRQFADEVTWRTRDETEKRAHAVADAIVADRKARAKREGLIARLPARQRRKRGSAVAFLQAQLAGGERPSKLVIGAAAREDIALRTLERAKARLGVVSRRHEFAGPWFWRLP